MVIDLLTFVSLFRRDNISIENAIVCIENSIWKHWFEAELIMVLLHAVDYNDYASGTRFRKVKWKLWVPWNERNSGIVLLSAFYVKQLQLSAIM